MEGGQLCNRLETLALRLDRQMRYGEETGRGHDGAEVEIGGRSRKGVGVAQVPLDRSSEDV